LKTGVLLDIIEGFYIIFKL